MQYLLARVREFADSPAGKKGRFTPYPSSWFTAEQYLDDPKEWQEKEEDRRKRESRAANLAGADYTSWTVPDSDRVVRL